MSEDHKKLELAEVKAKALEEMQGALDLPDCWSGPQWKSPELVNFYRETNDDRERFLVEQMLHSLLRMREAMTLVRDESDVDEAEYFFKKVREFFRLAQSNTKSLVAHRRGGVQKNVTLRVSSAGVGRAARIQALKLPEKNSAEWMLVDNWARLEGQLEDLAGIIEPSAQAVRDAMADPDIMWASIARNLEPPTWAEAKKWDTLHLDIRKLQASASTFVSQLERGNRVVVVTEEQRFDGELENELNGDSMEACQQVELVGDGAPRAA